MVLDEVYCTLIAITLAIVLFMSKTIFLVICSMKMDKVMWSFSKVKN
jgi:hypothetical protein